MTAKKRTTLGELDAAVKSAVWLTSADGASIHVARLLASALDAADDVRDIAQLSKQLNDVLQSLGLNVAGRTGKPEMPKNEVNPLDAIKERAKVRVAKAPAKNTRSGSTKLRSSGK